MKNTLPVLLFALFSACFSGIVQSQTPYYPPLTGNTWQTVSPASLGWCEDQLDSVYQYLAEKNTKAFIILKGGRIAAERYFGTFTRDSLWYWASAGKVLTAFMVGQAQEDGVLNIQQPTSAYLGNGWTSLPPDKEALITVRHQLTMSSGLDDGVADDFCTLPACLQYLADAGQRWAYHNAPYTLLTNVLNSATGQGLNVYFNAKIRNRIGMKGLWLPQGYNQIYYSDARSMARFGLLILRRGVWASDTLMRDTAYFNAMVNTSQNLNPSYGYLWWLNGKSSYKLPGLQFNFPGSIIQTAPDDLFAGLGKNDQKLYVIPSLDMVVVRLGETAGGASPALSGFDNTLWAKLMEVFCNVSAQDEPAAVPAFRMLPNPAGDLVRIQVPDPVQDFSIVLRDAQGRLLLRQSNDPDIRLEQFPSGVYFVTVRQGQRIQTQRLLHLRP